MTVTNVIATRGFSFTEPMMGANSDRASASAPGCAPDPVSNVSFLPDFFLSSIVFSAAAMASHVPQSV